MPKIEQFSRLINHSLTTSGQLFTIPTSNDHTDETWLATDLYVGEIGINVTDDSIFMRTNNGIVQISASGSGSSGASNLWNWSSPNIIIGSSYSADSVSPRSGVYTDLGTSTLRWKDLYLGGATSSKAIINVNTGLHLTEFGNGIINTELAGGSDNSPIIIGFTSSTIVKDRRLHLNSRDSVYNGVVEQCVISSSQDVILSGNNKNVFISGTNVILDAGITSSVHLGHGYGKTNYESNEVVASNLSLRGVGDDGSYQYIRSDWRNRQSLLRTSNALTTTIASIPWEGDGNVIQIKAYIIGTDIGNAANVYSAELMASVYGGPSYADGVVGVPVLNAVSSWSGTQPDCEISTDPSGAYIKVTGRGGDTIQWLCTYSHHRLVNVLP